MGGGAASTAICQTNGPILDPRVAFDSPGLELVEYVAKFHPNVTGRVKCQNFEYLLLLASPGKAAVSD